MDVSVFLNQFKIGFFYLLHLNAIKHLLLVLILVLTTDLKNWKTLLSNISIFTLGVFITLLLVNYNIIHIKTNFIVLILWVTIAVASILKIMNLHKGAFYSLVIGIFGALHGLKFYHHYYAVFSKKQIVLPTLFYSLGIEVAAIVFSVIVTGVVYVISIVSKTSKNNTESVLNALCLLVASYFIAYFFI